MIQGILLALLAAGIYGFLGISFEVAGKRQYKVWDFIAAKQLIGFAIGIGATAWLGLPILDWRLLMLGVIGALSYIITLAAYLVASRDRDIAANWTILNLSVALPILVSVVWFKDAFTPAKAVGALLTLVSIVVIGGGFRGVALKAGSRWLRFITVAFLFNGVLVILFRFVPEGYSALFTAYFYGLSFLMVLPYKLLRDRRWAGQKGLVGIAAAGAVTHWSGIMLTMAALAQVGHASTQAGVIVYPITNGLVIPVGVILGVLVLKQKISARTAMGVAVGVAALVCLFLP